MVKHFRLAFIQDYPFDVYDIDDVDDGALTYLARLGLKLLAHFFSWRPSLFRIFTLGIVGRCSLFEPNSEFSHRVCQTPFFQDASRHCRHGARRMSALRIVQQPRLKHLRVGILLNDVFKDFPLEGKPDGVGSLVALAAFAPSIGSIERGDQSFANVGRAERRH